jgi:hypothetical protein
MSEKNHDWKRKFVLKGVLRRLKDHRDQWQKEKNSGGISYVYTPDQGARISILPKFFSYQIRIASLSFDYGLFSGAFDIWLARHPEAEASLEAISVDCTRPGYFNHDRSFL